MKEVGRLSFHVIVWVAGFAVLVVIELATALVSLGRTIGRTYGLFLCWCDRLLARTVGRKTSGSLVPLFPVMILALMHV